ncbi:hypothetical protein NVP1072O_41 [Vibrio phage 1.072.O._10N.286.48.A12]|nr:hypothetical protein NVP1004O_40 [Vibrio phage 1.004.O._10N.261.54.A2]AUR83600.1 hypothetical protein NVP1037O_40 [Vibrio phage 1.037.O._10N.261.52.F7]AUR84485.1 hypothetical protein NVP1056O_43 [Vibrio phage 1.056.O._10N.261.48.C11]AUR85002.1 hypothetical protein NVP1066O_43 [Vibrio phage 1.066.O._10N.286.46.E8]AUR85133.1 hypothetical protein NVP1068O_43 [Vibrio phage 1.068.O._10N.261.51.F8]AUR85358.1 hypothetical protein NVP1072O_41 [Vibrio phage 1.072.O._10N.286.48.A12]
MFTPMPAPVKPPKLVSRDEAIELCELLYVEMSSHGFYPALTGGLLYKPGRRKDIDIVIFRNRQSVSHFEMEELTPLLEKCGVKIINTYGFVTKAEWKGYTVDLFNPETEINLDNEEYPV